MTYRLCDCGRINTSTFPICWECQRRIIEEWCEKNLQLKPKPTKDNQIRDKISGIIKKDKGKVTVTLKPRRRSWK